MASLLSLRQALGRAGIQRLVAHSISSNPCWTEACRHLATVAAGTRFEPNRLQYNSSNRNYNNTIISQSSLFHSTAFRLDEEEESEDSLVDLLDREYEEETANDSTKMPEDLKELKSQLEKAGWKIVDHLAMTKMVRTLPGGLKVQVVFHCQDMVESEPFYDSSEEDTDDEGSTPGRFTVIASKAGQTILFTCLSEDGVAKLQSVAVTSSDDDTALLNNGAVPTTDYQGPEFSELAEDVQEAFQDYLDDLLGYDEDVAAFMAEYAEYKEHVHYVDFLKKVKTLLK